MHDALDEIIYSPSSKSIKHQTYKTSSVYTFKPPSSKIHTIISKTLKMFSSIVLLTTALTGILAAPLDSRTTPAYFNPKTTYTYDVGTGAIDCTATQGLISKDYNNNGHDQTTLLTFEYPAASAGKTCHFEFSLDGSAQLSGSKKIDLFSSLGPAPGCTSTWGPGNQRNIHMGRMDAVLGGTAAYEYTYSAYLTSPTPCAAPGTIEAYELVGVFDQDYVQWSPALAGLRIVYE